MGVGEDHQPWSQQDSYPPVSSATDDDFSHLLDFGVDLDFPLGDGSRYGVDQDSQTVSQQPWNHSSYQPDSRSLSDVDKHQSVSRDQPTPRSAFLPTTPMEYHNDEGAPSWLPSQPFQPHYSVPPTPNSSEMYPAPYLQQTMSHPSQRYFQYRKDEGTAAFTPHESPQFMGDGASMSFADFADPNTFNLDPLTSPAMNPQPGSAHSSIYMLPHTADSSVAGSPIDLNPSESSNLSSSYNERPRKTRKKASQSTSAGGQTAPRSSTSAPARRRQGSVSTRNQAKSGQDTSSQSRQRDQTPRKQAAQPASDIPDSTSASASPQPVSDPVMAPPPKPSSVKSTPTLTPLTKAQSVKRPPATPASLMRLANSGSSGSPGTVSPNTNAAEQLHNSLEELTLPEAATPALTTTIACRSVISKQDPSSVVSTPILAANNSGSTVSNTASPIKANTPGSKGPQPRGSRKRNSTSSQLISPALRPRISPSIKPLLPDAGHHHISDETHALLLASKSNYQNLLEGNHLPGVSYPAELSTNLTSKRTSHKIAEQGRRNRINTALQEMQNLLPPTSPTGGNEASPNGDGGGGGSSPGEADKSNPKAPNTPGQTGNSKAATVEQAIEYIKTLNAKIADQESENAKLKEEMAVLKEKLDGTEGD